MLVVLINNDIIHHLLQNFLYLDLIVPLSITCKSLYNHIAELKQILLKNDLTTNLNYSFITS